MLIIATLAALEHECAHAFAARKFGYTLDKIVLMPYGAAIKGDLGGISPKEEIWVCLSGPLVNAATAALFVALWWLFPETYPYTDVAAYVCFSLFAVNLLPAYPLDGGRLLLALLRPLGDKKRRAIAAVFTLLTAAALIGLFIASCFSAPNYSVLLFAVLLLAGGTGGGSYRRIVFSREKSFTRGVEERRIALSADRTVGYAVRFLREDKYTVFELFRGEEYYGELPEEELLKGMDSGDWKQPVGKLLPEP